MSNIIPAQSPTDVLRIGQPKDVERLFLDASKALSQKEGANEAQQAALAAIKAQPTEAIQALVRYGGAGESGAVARYLELIVDQQSEEVAQRLLQDAIAPAQLVKLLREMVELPRSVVANAPQTVVFLALLDEAFEQDPDNDDLVRVSWWILLAIDGLLLREDIREILFHTYDIANQPVRVLDLVLAAIWAEEDGADEGEDTPTELLGLLESRFPSLTLSEEDVAPFLDLSLTLTCEDVGEAREALAHQNQAPEPPAAVKVTLEDF